MMNNMGKGISRPKQLGQLMFYNGFLADDLLLLYEEAAHRTEAIYQFYPLLMQKSKERGLFHNIWHCYFVDRLLTDDNLLTRTLSLRPCQQLADTDLWQLACQEVGLLRQYFARPLPATEMGLMENIVKDLQPVMANQVYGRAYGQALADFCRAADTLSTDEFMYKLADFHYGWGYGDICRFNFFSWKNGLYGIARADEISLWQLIGYQEQKETLLANTKAFLDDKPANNVLLYGPQGTGKSSMVKAIANNFADTGLRLVALSRYDLRDMAEILLCLSQYRQKFMLFLDDFSFDNDEKDYKYIKTYIEGGAAILPANVLLYATSNRRHLVAESWRDRREGGEDIHIGDTVAEKLSLSQRFGITIHFPSPDQEQYLSIVEGIAKNEGLDIDSQDLRREALKWERWQNSRSARTARQFINNLISRNLTD
jgi:predicted AAA+ superfamily ATPase